MALLYQTLVWDKTAHMASAETQSTSQARVSCREVLTTFLRLGCTSFGGPVAHVGYFREEFVVRRRWCTERTYADLIALCQLLPGPTSSQVALGIGLLRAGVGGALAAWLGFTLPSAILLLVFATGLMQASQRPLVEGGLHGLRVVAVAVVARAVWGMATRLCPDRARASVALLAAVLALAWPGFEGQLAAIVLGGVCGGVWVRIEMGTERGGLSPGVSPRLAGGCLVVFVLGLVSVPMLGQLSHSLEVGQAFYRAGALVFGGGHVVLPLLRTEVVQPGWVSEELFLAGYGAAQAVPGPLFSFAAYLGAVLSIGPGGWSGGALCLLAIFLPSFLLVIGLVPFWERLRHRLGLRAVVAGINASVVGLLLAALYDPVWIHGIRSGHDVMLGLAAFGLLSVWQLPAWLVVIVVGVGGALLIG